MTDLPILFSAPMIRALLAGSKTQTRRLVTFPGIEKVIDFVKVATDEKGRAVYEMKDASGQFVTRPAGKGFVDYHYSPRIAVGDRLWVREAWRSQEHFDDQSPAEICAEFEAEYGAASCPALYEADKKCDGHSVDLWQQSPPGRLRASMHMPRCASRLTLIVTNVRIERLQAISEEDAIAEGCAGCLGPNPDFPDEWDPSPREEYRDLWNEINGAGAWNANPWVVAYTFTVIQKNIDEVQA